MTDTDGAALLTMTDIVKEFPGVRALDGVDLDVRAGEVHCLLGQNGAGKSTLIKVLSGAHQPEEGAIRWQGKQVQLTSPIAAMRLGIATIYQELDLVDGLSVAENIFLGHERSAAGFTRRRQQNSEARRLLDRLGHGEIPATREVGRLSAAGKQIVSMARALSHDARLIVMDEPSAVLAHDEVGNLFRVIRDLTADGVAVVYISHRLEEIRTIGDRVTVLKDGRTVATGLPARTTPTKDVVSLMTGRTIEYAFPQRRGLPSEGDELLRVEHLSSRGIVHRRQLQRARGRDRRPRRTGRRWPLGGPRDRLRSPPAYVGNGDRDGQEPAARATSRPPCAPASGWPPRSARARRCCSVSRSCATCRWPPSLGSPGSAG